MIPRLLADDPYALVIVDWSWWVRRAWHISGVDGVAAIVIGNLARLLSDPMPPSIAVAVDAPSRRTFRHRATADMPEEQRYKANRPVMPEELKEIERRLLDVIEAHRIPILRPADPTAEQDWEADDSAATAVKLAVSEGRSVALLTLDKDWLQLVQTSDPTAPLVIGWDGRDKVTDDNEVIASWGVQPDKMLDLLGMCGDPGDNIPGVKGLGKVGAKKIILEHGSMDAALEATPISRPERLLHEQKDAALFSRSMVKLWDSACIEWDPSAQMVGDFDVHEIRKLYRSFGFSRLADEVPQFGKAAFAL